MIDVGEAKIHVRRHDSAHAVCTVLLFHGNGEVVADYDDTASEEPHFVCTASAL